MQQIVAVPTMFLGQLVLDCSCNSGCPQNELMLRVLLIRTQCHAEGGATKGGVSKCEQTQANADKRGQTQTNAEAKTQANASKRGQTQTNAYTPPLYCGFLHPLCNPLKHQANNSQRAHQSLQPIRVADLNSSKQYSERARG